ncbi:hypothetical protein [Pseudorhodoferax soli]|uniref:hypothetical protein n=1 Tax=Pseudorhodoferax soli TaxID=545864 RepID=UPI001B86F647|nr:hypothetical protein [Pseudorhodoferax soli]
MVSKRSVKGTLIAMVGDGLALVRTGPEPAPRKTPASESARVLLPKLGRALSRPGLPRSSVFTRPGIFAYSAHPDNPRLLVQEAEDGSRVTGRMIGAKFVPCALPEIPVRKPCSSGAESA